MRAGYLFVAAALCVSGFGVANADVLGPNSVEIVDMKASQPLTAQAGDAENGGAVFKDRKLGNCLACHVNSAMAQEPFHGEVGPSLDGVADRWSAEELRAIVINSKEIFGDQTIMPGFYSLDLGERVAEKFEGKTILSAQQVEDVVAYLVTLKE